MVLPARIIAPLQQRTTENRYQLREARMHAWTVQALVVIFPEHLPVALDGLRDAVPDDQLVHMPIIQAVERQIEARAEGGRLPGKRHEYKTVPLGKRQIVEGVFGGV